MNAVGTAASNGMTNDDTYRETREMKPSILDRTNELAEHIHRYADQLQLGAVPVPDSITVSLVPDSITVSRYSLPADDFLAVAVATGQPIRIGNISCWTEHIFKIGDTDVTIVHFTSELDDGRYEAHNRAIRA